MGADEKARVWDEERERRVTRSDDAARAEVRRWTVLGGRHLPRAKCGHRGTWRQYERKKACHGQASSTGSPARPSPSVCLNHHHVVRMVGRRLGFDPVTGLGVVICLRDLTISVSGGNRRQITLSTVTHTHIWPPCLQFYPSSSPL